MINIVLVEPEIPQNTGNIVRTAAATGARVHIVKPMSFEVTDKHLKRAGLDYWHLVDITYYDSLAEVLNTTNGAKVYYASTKSGAIYAEANLSGDVYIVFGKESKGLNEEILRANYDNCIRIPMVSDARSLNLANSVAIIVYEALRQNQFSGLKCTGTLTT